MKGARQFLLPGGRAFTQAARLTLTLFLGLLSSNAEEILHLITYTNRWSYNQDAVQPPADWVQPGFNDSAWPVGDGIFAVPENENLGGVGPLNTVLSLYAPSGTNQVITYYFRTTFTLPYQPDSRFVFTANTLIDDGAVFYVNGTELSRIGVGSGPISYSSPATRSREVSSGSELLNIPLSAIQQGQNTFAVEVHQSIGSTDAVFGLSLTARVLDPVQIVREPEDVAIEEGQNLVLSVEVTGSDPTYQWYWDGARLPSHVLRELVLLNRRMSDSGVYHVVVSNALNVVTSRLAAVTVLRDTNAPVLLSAEQFKQFIFVSPSSNQVELTFNEPVARGFLDGRPGATNPANYVVREYDTTNILGINGVSVAVNLNLVRLTLATNLRAGAHYSVRVTDVSDVRSNRMTIPGFAYVGLYQSNRIASTSAPWAWDESGVDLGTAWREPDYNDHHWPRGRGVFAFEFDNIDLCGGVRNTSLSLGPTTYYFRFSFVVPRTSGKVSFVWSETIDDGAIFYLNGVEIRRVNMTNGPVNAYTRALAVREGTCSSGVVVTATNLIEGTNVLAAEVHQAAADFDVVFGMQIDALIQLPYPRPVPLSIAQSDTGEFLVSWPGREGLLQRGPTPEGPWMPMTTNSPAVFVPEPAAAFFRLDPYRH